MLSYTNTSKKRPHDAGVSLRTEKLVRVQVARPKDPEFRPKDPELVRELVY